jgi:hypothetical protein
MKRDAFPVMVMVIIGMLFLSVSCSATTTLDPVGQIQPELFQNPAVTTQDEPGISESVPETADPTPVDEPSQQNAIAKPVKPKRVFRIGYVTPFGDSIVVSNETGYTLVQLDIFSERMYRENDDLENLLPSEELIHHGQQRIILSEVPSLQEALQRDPKESFTIHAIDTDGDRYTLSWQPERDSWNIVLSPEELDFSSQTLLAVPPQGGNFFITNNTGYPLNALYVIHPEFQEGAEHLNNGEHTNLLGSSTFLPGSIVQIATEDTPWIADQLPFDAYGSVVVRSQDIEGDFYQKMWYPTSDIWNVELTIDDLQYDDLAPIYGDSGLYIQNNTGFEIWYLYIMNGEMFAEHAYGDDLLEDSTLDVGEGIFIDLSTFAHLDELLASGQTELWYLVGLDIDDREYYRPWSPMEDGWELELNDGNFQPIPLPEATYDYTTLLLENTTGEDIWFLYLVTDAMAENDDTGKDVLGDVIWRADAMHKLVPESFPHVASWLRSHPEIPLTLLAQTYGDVIYRRTWSPLVDGWLITLSEEHKQE